MKKSALILFILLGFIKLYAQDYSIRFQGAGKSAIVDSVKVENITQKKSITLSGSEVLHLKNMDTGNNSIKTNMDYPLHIYPNPSNGNCTIEFGTKHYGSILLKICDLIGGEIVNFKQSLPSDLHTYNISGLSNGIYIIKVNHDNQTYSGKIICNNKSGSQLRINYNGNKGPDQEISKIKDAIVERFWQFYTGDSLKFIGKSGTYTSVIIDAPTSNKTLSFTFLESTDSDGNIYPSKLLDGNTVVWYDSSDLTTITKDGSTGEVSLWKDKLLSGRDLKQLESTKEPIWSATGIRFDGINDFMKTDIFTLKQPEVIYMLVKPLSWNAFDYIFDGYTNSSGMLAQMGAEPLISASSSGVFDKKTNQLIVNEYRVMEVVFNNPTSSIRINDNAKEMANQGSRDMGGLTLARPGTSELHYGNYEVKAIIIRKVVDDSQTRMAIRSYLSSLIHDSLADRKTTTKGLISFSYDDGFDTNYSFYYKLHKAVGVPGNAAFITDRVGTPGYVTWDQIKEMDATLPVNGQIKASNHTKSHSDLSKLTEQQIIAEIESSQDAFTSHGLKPNVLVYPWGLYNENVIKIAQHYFKCARSTSALHGQEVSIPIPYQYVHAKNSVYIDVLTVKQVKDLIDSAVTYNKWLVFYSHSPNFSIADYTDILTYAKNRSIVVEIEDGFYYGD